MTSFIDATSSHTSQPRGEWDEIRNLRVSLKQKTSQNHRKKILKMRNLLKMEHSPLLCDGRSRSRRLRPKNAEGRRRRRKELWNQKIISAAMFLVQAFSISILFMFLSTFFRVEKKQSKKDKNLVPSGQSINLDASAHNRVTGLGPKLN